MSRYPSKNREDSLKLLQNISNNRQHLLITFWTIYIQKGIIWTYGLQFGSRQFWLTSYDRFTSNLKKVQNGTKLKKSSCLLHTATIFASEAVKFRTQEKRCGTKGTNPSGFNNISWGYGSFHYHRIVSLSFNFGDCSTAKRIDNRKKIWVKYYAL
jgi:hypothetical protein